MRKFVGIAAFIVAVSVLSIPAFAQQGPQVTVSPNQVTLYNIAPGNSQTITASIKNTDTVPHTFVISVVPSFWNYVTSLVVNNSVVTVFPGETQNISILLSAAPSANYGNKILTVSAVDSQDNQTSGNTTVLVSVIRKSPVYIVGISTSKQSYNPGDTATISTKVTNVETGNNEQFALQVVVTNNNQVLQQNSTIIQPITVGTSKIFNTTFMVPKDSGPGVYNIQALLINNLGFTVSEESGSFVVGQVSTESKTSTFGIGFLTTTTTIADENTGNVPTFLVINVTVPNIAKSIFIPQAPPTAVETYSGGTVYSWISSTPINPGENFSISYSYVVWQIWLMFILIAAIVYFAFQFVFTPSIRKTHSHAGGPLTKDKEVSISLDVTNRSAHEVKDLVVKDFVPPTVKVVPRFGTVRPQVRESTRGTELTWKFDSLKAGEERILTYKVKPTVDIMGALRLPKASLNYSDRKKQKKVVASRETFMRSQR